MKNTLLLLTTLLTLPSLSYTREFKGFYEMKTFLKTRLKIKGRDNKKARTDFEFLLNDLQKKGIKLNYIENENFSLSDYEYTLLKILKDIEGKELCHLSDYKEFFLGYGISEESLLDDLRKIINFLIENEPSYTPCEIFYEITQQGNPLSPRRKVLK